MKISQKINRMRTIAYIGLAGLTTGLTGCSRVSLDSYIDINFNPNSYGYLGKETQCSDGSCRLEYKKFGKWPDTTGYRFIDETKVGKITDLSGPEWDGTAIDTNGDGFPEIIVPKDRTQKRLHSKNH